MSLAYAFGKLETAVEELVGEGEAKERLMRALDLVVVIDPSDFPTEQLRAEHAAILEALTWLPGDESKGTADATLEAMTEEEAAQLNRRLFNLYTDAAGHLYG